MFKKDIRFDKQQFSQGMIVTCRLIYFLDREKHSLQENRAIVNQNYG